MDEEDCKTLFVGNLDPTVTRELIIMLFSSFGEVQNCNIISDMGVAPYGFVEMSSRPVAALALSAMNGRMCCGRELKVNWATPPKTRNVDTTNHHHIFVGDLSPDVDNSNLRGAFEPLGQISDCRVVRDPLTQNSKGYGFISFVNKAEAENAISVMNGVILGGRSIRTNWAARKGPTPRPVPEPGCLNYSEVYQQAGPTNSTVYCRSELEISEDDLYELFSPFGEIVETRMFRHKGYYFIRYHSKEAATMAIVSLHNKEYKTCRLKCSWGKEAMESIDSSNIYAPPAIPSFGPPTVWPAPPCSGPSFHPSMMQGLPPYM